MSKWRYFSYATDRMLACPCCGIAGMDNDFMLSLDALRGHVGFPLVITSGYRCPNYNDQISSTGRSGPHTTGKAVDVAVVGNEALELIVEGRLRGFTGFGVKQHSAHGKRFLHLDMLSPDETPGPRPWIWSYP